MLRLLPSRYTLLSLGLVRIEARSSRVAHLTACIVGCLHLLIPSDCSTIKATSHMTYVGERFLLAKDSLVKQMVRRSDVIMTVGFDAFDRVVWIKAKVVENLLVNVVFYWH